MLPRQNRLSRIQVNWTKEKGVMLSGESFGLLASRHEGDRVSKFGFVISKKISKKATERNLARRRLREAVKQNLAKFPAGNFVFLAKKALLGKELWQLKEEVNAIISRIAEK